MHRTMISALANPKRCCLLLKEAIPNNDKTTANGKTNLYTVFTILEFKSTWIILIISFICSNARAGTLLGQYISPLAH